MKLNQVALTLVGVGLFACGGETDTTDPDLTPPIVILVAPAGGALVTGVISLSATATDSSGIAGVTFRADGATIGAVDLVAPFGASWNTAAIGDGTHELTAVASDSAGNIATSAAVSIVVDNTLPTVVVTAPAAGDTVDGEVAVSASAGDAGGIAGVSFRLDGVTIGVEDLSPPYAISWNSAMATEGTHQLTAVARDSSGHTMTSTAVDVVVDNVAQGTIHVVYSSSGGTGDPDGTQLLIDSVATSDTFSGAAWSFDTTVAPGLHSITLMGLSSACTVAGGTARAVAVVDDQTTNVTFTAGCGFADVIAVIVSPLDTSVSGVQLRRPDGTLLATPLRSTGYILDVALAPDGRRLAYATGIVSAQIRLRDLVSGVDSILVEPTGQVTRGMFDWSPDGSRLAYRDSNNALAILTLATGVSSVVPNGDQANAPEWSPDGQYVAFTGIRDTNQSVFRVTPEGAGFTQLTFPPFGTGDTEARWSPDGTKLILASTRDGSPAIWIGAGDGTGLTQVTPGGSVESFPRWSAAGDRIAFIRGHAVWVRTLATGAESLLYSAGAAEVLGIDWAH